MKFRLCFLQMKILLRRRHNPFGEWRGSWRKHLQRRWRIARMRWKRRWSDPTLSAPTWWRSSACSARTEDSVIRLAIGILRGKLKTSAWPPTWSPLTIYSKTTASNRRKLGEDWKGTVMTTVSLISWPPASFSSAKILASFGCRIRSLRRPSWRPKKKMIVCVNWQPSSLFYPAAVMCSKCFRRPWAPEKLAETSSINKDWQSIFLWSWVKPMVWNCHSKVGADASHYILSSLNCKYIPSNGPISALKNDLQDAARIAMKASEVKMTGHGWSPCWHRIKTTVSFAAEYLSTNGLFWQPPIVWTSEISAIFIILLPWWRALLPCFLYLPICRCVYATANGPKRWQSGSANSTFDGQASRDAITR